MIVGDELLGARRRDVKGESDFCASAKPPGTEVAASRLMFRDILMLIARLRALPAPA
jgi:hypothetical protein